MPFSEGFFCLGCLISEATVKRRHDVAVGVNTANSPSHFLDTAKFLQGIVAGGFISGQGRRQLCVCVCT